VTGKKGLSEAIYSSCKWFEEGIKLGVFIGISAALKLDKGKTVFIHLPCKPSAGATDPE